MLMFIFIHHQTTTVFHNKRVSLFLFLVFVISQRLLAKSRDIQTGQPRFLNGKVDTEVCHIR